jgi:hypothetical protein
MKVLTWPVVLLMAVLGLMASASAVASAAPDTQADAAYLELLDQNGVSSPNPEEMVAFAHHLVDELSASPGPAALSVKMTRSTRILFLGCGR